MSEEKSVRMPRAATYDEKKEKPKDPWEKLRKRPGVKILSTASRP